MAVRHHFRYVVRDAYGYAIQNAKVNIYLPDTTTVFGGSAFTADSGGDSVTNPFTTNDQGEIEAWFTTPQEVDVQVDDNSNLAYRAVEGSSAAFSFATFTEKDTIVHSPDVTHGAAYHTNITRSIFLPVSPGVVQDGGTLVSHGTEPDAVRAIELADAANTGALWFFMLPDDFTGSSIDIEIWHAGATTTSGSVRWQVNMHTGSEGTSVVTAQGTAEFTGQAPTTADLLVKEAVSSLSVSPSVAGDFVRLSIRRDGADAADNYAATTRLLGVRIYYSATQ